MNLLQIAQLSEDEARKLLERIRWPEGPTCPHCSFTERIYSIEADESKKIRPGLYECGGCKRQFTVTVKTVMEDSKLTCKQWVLAFYSVCAHKKGVSALQLQRDLGLGSYRTAWHLAHRIRHAMKEEPLAGMLMGTVEADETYMGGKPRKKIETYKTTRKRGRGTNKTPVSVLVERNGNAVARPLESLKGEELKGALKQLVDPSSKIVTDDFTSYRGAGKDFAGGHSIVRHSSGRYVNKAGEHTNTAESFFALLKRGHYGVFHHMSKRHLHRYCAEFTFRWNMREATDGERMEAAIRGADGKRLTYRKPMSK